MTVTSVPAPVLPAEPAPSDSSTGSDPSEAAASGSHFASLLQGLHGHEEQTGTVRPPAKNAGAGRNPPGTRTADPKTPGAGTSGAAPATDPALAALLRAYAGTLPPDSRAGAAVTLPDATTATNADAAPAPSTAAAILAAAAGAARPATAGAPGAPGTAANPTAMPAAPATPTVAPASADPILVAIAAQTAGAPGTAPAPAPPTDVDTSLATTAAGAAPAPGAQPAPAASTAPASKPEPAPAGTDVAVNTAAAAAAGPNPIVRSDPAPKTDAVADNAMITAATAAADRAAAPAPTVAASAAPAPAAPLPPPAAEQLVAVLRPLHRSPDGTYQIRIEMRPPELGRVDMRVEMKDGVLHASIHAERSDTADLVRAALDDLRSRLDADGVRAGQLSVDAQGAGTSGRDQQATTPDRTAAGTAPIADPAVAAASAPTTTVTSDSLLDVRI